jgi:hypothetical protein
MMSRSRHSLAARAWKRLRSRAIAGVRSDLKPAQCPRVSKAEKPATGAPILAARKNISARNAEARWL